MKIVEIKTKPRLVSIVIPNYFTGKSGGIVKHMDEALWFAGHCFERIRKYTTLPYELVLVDDSPKVNKNTLKKYADVLVINEENLGFAKAANRGFKVANGDMICCMNNDVFVWPGWLEALIKTFEDNPNCGVAMPALMKQTKNGVEALGFGEIDLRKNYDAYGAGAEFGSCWLSKKEILDKIKEMNDGNVFDENFKVGFGEDRRLWGQIRMLGYQTYRTHKTRVFHQGNVSMSKVLDRKKYTIPNRAYLKELKRIEAETNRSLFAIEKKQLKEKIEQDYIQHWDSDRKGLKERWGF